MELDYTYWKSKDGWFVGYLNIWPEHLTQGHDLAELEEMLTEKSGVSHPRAFQITLDNCF